ncbi:hypothetical protein EDC04DRAFT_2904865 [Pisolithus marmoratus]|nr:hypothetical protein EDC04DRAFT_2904865 [Pisolithus marmoratus]
MGPMPPALTLPLASLQHSAQVTNESTLLDPHMHESLYEKVCLTITFLSADIGLDICLVLELPSCGQPLSYAEILRCWAEAVIKRQHAVDSMEEAQEEYEDHASNIITVVGQDEYNKFLENLLGALKECSPSASGKV